MNKFKIKEVLGRFHLSQGEAFLQAFLPKKNGFHTEISFNAGCGTYIAKMVHKAGKLLKYQRKPYRYEFEDSRDEFIMRTLETCP